MKSVAFYCYSPKTRDLIHQSKADEIWSVNWVWQYDVPRVDRLLDMHPRWHLQAPGDMMQEHWAWLQEPHDFPIYMLEPFPEVPNCVLYPIDEVIANVGRRYFTSSVAYLLGLALLEGFDRIELYGIEMASGTEYAYQKAGTEYLIGLAEGRGVEVCIPDNSNMLNSALYGYDGGFQMISRQTPEKIRSEYQKQFDQRITEFQKAKGAYDTLKEVFDAEDDPVRKKEIDQRGQVAYKEYLTAKDNTLACDVSLQVMQDLLDNVDLKPTDLNIVSSMSVKVD